tara:strand:+ start:435 stop:833 length:399 start_codon:yes stop_codon:yes gene_type:complete
MELNPLIPIGSKVKIDKSRIKNMSPKKLIEDLPRMISGEVIDYKMTDGMGIGYVLMTENNLKIWIFNSELDEKTKQEYKIKQTLDSETKLINDLKSRISKVNYDINGNRKIKTIANPLNIISWLIFAFKDIF